MIVALPSVEQVNVSIQGIPDVSYGPNNAFVVRARVVEREIGFLLVEHDRHQKNKIRFLESWTDGDFLDQGLQAKLSQIAEEVAMKSLDISAVPDRGHKNGWSRLRP